MCETSRFALLLLLFTDDRFQQLQRVFLDRHYMVFEDTEENKLIYTDIHREYVSILTVTVGRGGAKGGMRRGRHCAGAAFGWEFRNSASGKLSFALQSGFGGFVGRLQ